MKILYNISILALLLFIAASCQKGIDPISKVEPGPDQTAPVVKINYPTAATVIRDDAPKVKVKFQCEASDDIELASIVLQLDGTQIATFNSFKDYRRGVEEFIYDGVTDGIHTLTVTATDKAGKTGAQTVQFQKTTPYHPIYDGEVFYMPFDGDAIEQVSNISATVVGSPKYVDGKKGKAYAGATDAYLNFPTTNLIKTKEVSAAFWMKVNALPDRAGILTVSREDSTNAGYPAIQNKRTSGFRFFREGSATSQRFKVNVGMGGTLESWNDGGTVDPSKAEWVHLAFTVSGTKSTIYINGVKALDATVTPIDWTGCNLLTIMSGVPRFTEWNHKSDLSLIDELRFFNKALTAAEVTTLFTAK